MESQNNTETAQEQQENGTGKTFTQEEVNTIVSDRLKREREKLNKEQEEKLKQREEAIKERELRLLAAEKLTAAGLPKTLVDALNCSSEETTNKSIKIISEAFQEYTKGEGVSSERKVQYAPKGAGYSNEASFRNAMGIK